MTTETHVIEPLPRLAISLYAPWVWACLYGGKPCENRHPGFPEFHAGKRVLGEVWLHASLFPGKGALKPGSSRYRTFEEELQAMEDMLLEAKLLHEDHGDADEVYVQVPKLERLDSWRGHIVGRVTVTGYRPPSDPPDSPWYVPGSKAIMIADPKPLATPIVCSGARGWWPVPDDVLEQLRVAA